MEILERCYTEDFDQEMLDWLVKNKPNNVYGIPRSIWWLVVDNYLTSYTNNYGVMYSTTSVTEAINNNTKLSKSEFKRYIGMPEEENKMNTFTKDDLKTGHLVVLRGGREVVIFKDCASVYTQNGNKYGTLWVDLNSKHTWGTLEDEDIMEVYLQSHPYSFVREYEKDERVLLWKREEKSEKDLQIEKLQATITQAQAQINKLKEMK